MFTKTNPMFARFSFRRHAAQLPASAGVQKDRSARRRTGARTTLALALAATAQLGVGCGGGDLDPQVLLIDHTTAPLSLGSLNALNGTYGSSCIGRSGSWSVAIGTFTGGLENPQLSVVKGNNTCVLTLTSVLIGSNKYVPTSSVALTDSYSGTAVAFKQEMMSAVAFYGNLKLSDATYSSSFAISLMFSDDSGLASAGSAQATYKYNSLTASQSSVVPTDYAVDGSSVGVQTDANQTISDVVGNIALTDGTVLGQEYVITSLPLGATPSFDDIDAAFSAGTPIMISGSNPSVSASDLNLVGASLAGGSITREVIVAHIVQGIRAYQLITLTVLGPQ
jgi:hypothetical protein